MEVTVTTENFESLLNGDKPLVVDFWATWCGPCRQLGPIISELAEQYEGQIVVGKCDVEENDALATQFAISSIPCVLFFKGGKQVDKFIGFMTKAKVEDHFKKLL
jgi:thioredoxin 1